MSFDVALRHDGDHAILDMRGDIDAGADGALDTIFSQALESSRVVLNFTEVAYINSTGIAVIVGLLRRAQEESRSLAAFGLTDHYKSLFEITRLSDFVQVEDDEASAKQGG